MRARIVNELRNPYAWGYAAILLVACLLRFWQVADIGLFGYDDARLLHFTNTVYSLAHEGLLPPRPEFFSSAKPGAIFPFVGAALIFTQQDALLAVYTAFWGVIVVAMTMIVARKITKNNAAALCAGLLSALSPLQIYYSRGFNVAGSMSMLFVLLILYFYLQYYERRTPKNAIMLGGVMGYAFTVNYSLLPYISLFALFVLLEAIRGNNKEKIHLVPLGLAIMVAPIIFELSYRLLKLSDGRFFSYFAMLQAHKSAIVGMDHQIYFDPLYYISLLAKYDGISFVLAMCGIFFAFKIHKARGDRLPLISGIVVAIMCTALAAGTAFLVSVPRTSYSVIPLLPIVAAVAIASFSVILARVLDGREKSIRLLVGAVMAVLVGSALFWNAARVGEVENLQSGYKQAAAWVNTNGGKAGCYVNCIIYETYSDAFVSLMEKPAGTENNYLVVDVADRMLLGKQDFYGWGKYAADRSYISLLDKSQEPLAVFDNSIGVSELFTLEMGGGRSGTKANENLLNGQIRVYSYPN